MESNYKVCHDKVSVVNLTLMIHDSIHELVEDGKVGTHITTISDGKGFIVLSAGNNRYNITIKKES